MKSLACVLALLCCAPSAPRPSAQEREKNDPRLVAIGGLSVTATYVSFVCVGVVADAFSKDVYDAKQVNDMMTEIAGLMKTNSRQLGALPKGEISKADVDSVDEIVAIMGLIGEYAQSLIDYSKDKVPAKAKTFDQKRESTWTRLKKLMGIK
jgi:hypothetical protein